MSSGPSSSSSLLDAIEFLLLLATGAPGFQSPITSLPLVTVLAEVGEPVSTKRGDLRPLDRDKGGWVRVTLENGRDGKAGGGSNSPCSTSPSRGSGIKWGLFSKKDALLLGDSRSTGASFSPSCPGVVSVCKRDRMLEACASSSPVSQS